MQSLFPIVVFGAVGLSIVMSIVFLLSKGSLYDQIGEGGLGGEGDGNRRTHGAPGQPGASPGQAELPFAGESSLVAGPQLEQAEREQEIRQLVGARSERLVRRGEPALDVDAEVARLLAVQPAAAAHQRDQGIAVEVLQLVVARNERRERRGLEPLDIEAEVARTLAELDA